MRTSHRLPPPILNRLSRITVWKEKTETSCHGWFPPKKEACQISPGILHCASLRPVLQVHLCIEEPKKENTPTAPLCKGHRRPYSSHLSKRASASERERERDLLQHHSLKLPEILASLYPHHTTRMQIETIAAPYSSSIGCQAQPSQEPKLRLRGTSHTTKIMR